LSDLIITGSFAFFLIAFTAIGTLASRHKQTTSEDYLVASRSVNPWLTALSAVSTNNSGYMFIGLIGFAWRQGIEAVWISFGWVLGDLLTWFWVHKRVRAQSEEVEASSVPALLATSGDRSTQRVIATAAGLLTFFFLGGYAAAQLKAGSTTLHALFGWPIWLGSVLGVVVVAVYCMSGGIRASIWTDAAQSIVMIGAMSMLLGTCIMQVGGPSSLFVALEKIDPQLIELIPRGLAFGLGLYVLGFIFGGVGTIGQPHILIRFMAIDATDSIKKARIIYFVWYTFFTLAALAVGLYSRVLLPDLTAGLSGDAAVAATEAALPTLTVEMLPPVLIGVMLAGLFSATMSTADSQILSCSAAVTQDVFPRWSRSYTASKIATLSVAGLALAISLSASSGVFTIVLVAWSALAATLGPVLIIRLGHWPLSPGLAMVMMISGLATVIGWGASPWADSVFKALPGMVVPFLVYGLAMVILPSSEESSKGSEGIEAPG
jgi:sodium/proline symporter